MGFHLLGPPIKLKSVLLESRTSTLLPFYLIPLRIFYSTISWSVQPRIPLFNTSPTDSSLLVSTASRYASALVGAGGAKGKEVPQQHPWPPLCSPLCDQKKKTNNNAGLTQTSLSCGSCLPRQRANRSHT